MVMESIKRKDGLDLSSSVIRIGQMEWLGMISKVHSHPSVQRTQEVTKQDENYWPSKKKKSSPIL